MNKRFLQQLRLWVYIFCLMLIVINIFSGSATLFDFIIFGLVGFLPFTEFCNECGKLVWLERYNMSDWWGALWIGRQCKMKNEE